MPTHLKTIGDINSEEKGKRQIDYYITGQRILGPRTFLPRHKSRPEAGGFLEPGYRSNYGERKKAIYVYLTATLDTAAWGAELAVGDGHGRIYRVEPTGTIEDDPNLTDKKFLGNPTKSYRTRKPLSSGRSLGMEGTLPRGAPENAGSP